MDAKEARTTAIEINADKINSSYKSATEQINYNVKQGEFFVIFYDDLLMEAKKMLEEEGYKVTRIETGVNEYGWEIRW